MMFINPNMLEPTTISLCIFIATSATKNTLKYKDLLFKKPLALKRKCCKWIYKNKDSLIDISLDEGSDLIFDNLNNLEHLMHLNPSYFFIMYFIALIFILLF